MTDPARSPAGDGRILSPRLRLYLYAAAGIVFALWFSLAVFGAAGFVAFALGMLAAQAAFRWRPSLNAAFAAGLVVYAATILIWSAVAGAPHNSNRPATQTAEAIRDNG